MKSCHWNNIVIEVHSCLPATPRLQRFGTSKQVLWRKSFTFILFVYHFWSMRLNPRCSGVLRTSIMTIFGGNLKMPILSFFGQGYCRLDTHPRTHLAPPQGNTWGHRWTQGHACGDQVVDHPTQLICIWIFICWVGGGDPCGAAELCISGLWSQK